MLAQTSSKTPVSLAEESSPMEAYQLTEFAGPSALTPTSLASPEPGPGQVAVRIRAASLNYRDLMLARGIYNPKLKLPIIPVSDGAGEVIANGPGSTRFKPGDRVVANFMPGWVDGELDEAKARTALGAESAGMLAQEVVIAESGLLPIPESLSFEQAATLPCAGVTAWNAVVEQGRVRPGDVVLVQGTGGVSLFALQFAHAAGATVIATSGSDEKLARARALGATHGINYKTTPDWDRAARELTGGRGVDLVVEVGGAGTLPRSMKAVRMNGVVVLIGVLSGLGEVNPLPILMKGVGVQGIFVGSRVMFEAMLRAITANAIEPVIDRVFPFAEAQAAYEHLASQTHFGKIVIQV